MIMICVDHNNLDNLAAMYLINEPDHNWTKKIRCGKSRQTHCTG